MSGANPQHLTIAPLRQARVVTDRARSVVQWVAVIGAVSAQDVMARFGVRRTVGYPRLRALVEHGSCRDRPVHAQLAPYVATREGLHRRWCRPQIDPGRVGVATARPPMTSA